MNFLEYVLVLEFIVVLNFKDSYGLFINGEFVDGLGILFIIILLVMEKYIVEIVLVSDDDVDWVVVVVCCVYDKIWLKMSGCDCGKYLFCIVCFV